MMPVSTSVARRRPARWKPPSGNVAMATTHNGKSGITASHDQASAAPSTHLGSDAGACASTPAARTTEPKRTPIARCVRPYRLRGRCHRANAPSALVPAATAAYRTKADVVVEPLPASSHSPAAVARVAVVASDTVTARGSAMPAIVAVPTSGSQPLDPPGRHRFPPGRVGFSAARAGRLVGYRSRPEPRSCLLYTSDAADDLLCVDLGG